MDKRFRVRLKWFENRCVDGVNKQQRTNRRSIEVAAAQNSVLEYGGFSPNQAHFGHNPRGYYEYES